ncbi:MAG: pilus assembly protein TadG-related protein, partial [Cypionkella sp.]
RGRAADRSGSLRPMAAVGLVVVAAIVGGSIDMSRAYKAQTRLQAACAAAVLAGRKAVAANGFDSAVAGEADSYFANNFGATEHDAANTRFTPASPDNGLTVTGSASADIATVVMKIFGFTSMPVSVTCSASMGVGNSDVTMVLDTTGSMDDRLVSGGAKKIAMLRDAMKNFYDVVSASTAGGNARVRYAFVPYSQSINVGRLIAGLNPAFLVDRRTIQSREAVFNRRTTQTFSHWDTPVITTGTGESEEALVSQGLHNSNEYSTRNACNAALPANTAWASNGGPTSDTDVTVNGNGQRVTTITTTQGQRRTAYTCVQRTRGNGRNRVTYFAPWATVYERASYSYRYETQDPVYTATETLEFSHFVYKPVSYDVSSYKGFNPVTTRTGEDGANVTSTWAGCIEERRTTPAASFSYNRITGITPNSAIDLDIDTAPDTGNDDTRWSPMWPQVAYYRTSFVATGPGRGRYDLANNAESATGGQAPSSCPQRAQLLRTMTESEFDAYVDSLYPAGNTYHDLGMLWGARVSSPEGIFADTVNAAPANGGDVSRHLIFMTDGQMMPSIAVQSTYGIEFHDRRVTANGVNQHAERHTERFLAICEAVKAKGIRLWVIAFSTGLSNSLEECASDNSAFTADDADELNQAFQEIAKEVGELRITQ